MAQVAQRQHNWRIDKSRDGNITASVSSSLKAVLQGELLRESERRLLRVHLTSCEQNFTANHIYRIHLRMLWRPEAQANPTRRAGRCAVFVHAVSGRLTSSWAFIKFAKPLYEAGFSVVFFDLPGFGRSSMGGKCFVPYSEWAIDDVSIIVLALENIGVESANFVVHSDSAMLAMKILSTVPQVMQRQMVLWSPLVDLANLFDNPLAVPNSHTKDEQEQLSLLLKKQRMRLLAFFEQPTSAAGWKSMEVFSRCAANMWPNVKVGRLLPEDAAIAQAGAKVPVDIIVPSKQMVNLCLRHFTENLDAPWNVSPMERPPFPNEALHIRLQEDSNIRMEEAEAQVTSTSTSAHSIRLRGASGAPAVAMTAWAAEPASPSSTAIVPLATQAPGQGRGDAALRSSTIAPAMLALENRNQGSQAQATQAGALLPLMDRPMSQGAPRSRRGAETGTIVPVSRQASAAPMHASGSMQRRPSSQGATHGMRVPPGTRVRFKASDEVSAVLDSMPVGSFPVTMHNSSVWVKGHRHNDPLDERQQLVKTSVARHLSANPPDFTGTPTARKTEQPFCDEEVVWMRNAVADSRKTHRDEESLRAEQHKHETKFAAPAPQHTLSKKNTLLRLGSGADKIRAARDLKKTAQAFRSAPTVAMY